MKAMAFKWQCYECETIKGAGYRFSHIAGTIFENTKVNLREWFRVIHLMLTSKKGMSARQIHRYMGFGSYKTAWYMCHRIRAALVEKNFDKLDPLTVSMSHPDSAAALLSGSGSITAHYASPPFSYQEKAKGLRSVLTSYDTLGGPATFNVVWSTRKFHDQNPKAYAAFVAAFQEATDLINKDKKAAAETYKRMTGTADSLDELVKQLNDPKVKFTLEPHRLGVTAEFMNKVGRISKKPSSWKDLFFENVHSLSGS